MEILQELLERCHENNKQKEILIMNNREKYNQAFFNTFEVSIDNLNEHFNFSEVDIWDSMAHLTLIAELEDAFGVIFETDDILHFGGYENGMKILSRYGVNFND